MCDNLHTYNFINVRFFLDLIVIRKSWKELILFKTNLLDPRKILKNGSRHPNFIYLRPIISLTTFCIFDATLGKFADPAVSASVWKGLTGSGPADDDDDDVVLVLVLAGQKTNSLGTPIWPGLQDTPDFTSLHSLPCSVTQVPVLLCSDSSWGLYLTRHPRLPAQVPALLANPPHVSPNWKIKPQYY